MSHLHNSTCGNSGHIPSQSWQMERLYPLRRIKQGSIPVTPIPHIRCRNFFIRIFIQEPLGGIVRTMRPCKRNFQKKRFFVIVIPDQFTGHLTCPGCGMQFFRQFVNACPVLVPTDTWSNPDLHPAFEAVAITGNH